MAITMTTSRTTSHRQRATSQPGIGRSALYTLCAALVLACVALSGQAFGQEASTAAAASAETNPARSFAPEMRVSAGDLLEINVFDVKELNTQARVSGTGEVMMPLVGAVRVQGETADGVARIIEQRLRDGEFVRRPQVSVFISQYATQGVSVLGEVKKPGIYPLLGSHSLFDYISVAEGFTPTAGKTITITHRDSPNDRTVIEWNDNPQSNSKVNIPVLPGDTVVVSKAGVVYVVGDVGKPGGFVMDHKERLTVLQAIALAQGTNRTASLKSAKLIRQGPGGREEISIPLNEILSAKAADVPVRDEDIVFVPASGSKNAALRGMEAAIQVATGLAIYRRP